MPQDSWSLSRDLLFRFCPRAYWLRYRGPRDPWGRVSLPLKKLDSPEIRRLREDGLRAAFYAHLDDAEAWQVRQACRQAIFRQAAAIAGATAAAEWAEVLLEESGDALEALSDSADLAQLRLLPPGRLLRQEQIAIPVGEFSAFSRLDGRWAGQGKWKLLQVGCGGPHRWRLALAELWAATKGLARFGEAELAWFDLETGRLEWCGSSSEAAQQIRERVLVGAPLFLSNDEADYPLCAELDKCLGCPWRQTCGR